MIVSGRGIKVGQIEVNPNCNSVLIEVSCEKTPETWVNLMIGRDELVKLIEQIDAEKAAGGT